MSRTVKDIEQEISVLQKQESKIKGTPCEVYTRICGYFRSTRNWNIGKQSEFKDRKPTLFPL